jgi:hypothetical protein
LIPNWCWGIDISKIIKVGDRGYGFRPEPADYYQFVLPALKETDHYGITDLVGIGIHTDNIKRAVDDVTREPRYENFQSVGNYFLDDAVPDTPRIKGY